MQQLVAIAAILVLACRVLMIASGDRKFRRLTQMQHGSGRYLVTHTVTALHQEGHAAGLLLHTLLRRCRSQAGDTQQYTCPVIVMCTFASVVPA